MLPVQHLSDEAIAAYADGFLGSGARHRAGRHLEHCAECRQAVTAQREAVWMLRSATAPALPSGLLDRLRDVPVTTPMRPVRDVLTPDGAAVFPAYGTPTNPAYGTPTNPGPSSAPTRHRRLMNFGMVSAAAAVVTFGAVATMAAGDTATVVQPGAAPVVSPSAPTAPELLPVRLVRPVPGP